MKKMLQSLSLFLFLFSNSNTMVPFTKITSKAAQTKLANPNQLLMQRLLCQKKKRISFEFQRNIEGEQLRVERIQQALAGKKYIENIKRLNEKEILLKVKPVPYKIIKKNVGNNCEYIPTGC